MKKIIAAGAPEAIGPYSHGVTAGGCFYSSGQIPIDPETGKIVEGNIKEQTHQVIRNLEKVLEAAGSSIDKVIKTTCFLNDISDFVDFNEVYAEYFSHKPARSCVEVAALPKGALVEIEVIAEV